MIHLFFVALIACGQANKIPASNEKEHDELLWETFQEKFNKSYGSVDEKLSRRSIFIENLRYISHHNTVNRNTTFQMGINQFSDMTFKELERNNNIGEDKFYEDANFDDFDPPVSIVVDESNFPRNPPEIFDWREHGVNSTVKNQLLCGSCYAFVTLDALEGSIFLKTGKSIELSRQEIIDCATTHGTLRCHGGIMHGVFSYINQKGGLSLAADYPLGINASDCKENIVRVKFHIKTLAEFDTDDEDLLKRVLYNHGPLIVVVDGMHESFFRYSNGIYYEEDCNKDDRTVDHTVLLVGYGRENDLDYWIIKNSNGPLWGEAGYMRIARNKNSHCQITNFNLIPIIDESIII